MKTPSLVRNQPSECPICHKTRGKNDKTHGKCAEEQAKRDHERTIKRTIKGKEVAFSAEQIHKAQFNANSKRFANGTLPDWMYD